MLCDEGKRLQKAHEQATRAFGLFIDLMRNSPVGVDERRKNERLKNEKKAARAAYEKHIRNCLQCLGL